MASDHITSFKNDLTSNIIAPGMDQYSTSMSKQLKMVERLLAHARMCREVADECGNSELAADFNKLALECIQAAAACKEQPSPAERCARARFTVKTRVQCLLCAESGHLPKRRDVGCFLRMSKRGHGSL